MEPETIDTSIISISNPPENMDTSIGTAGPTHLDKSETSKIPSTSTPDSQQVDSTDSPQLTDALEALLGGLDPPTAETELLAISKETTSDSNTEVETVALVKDNGGVQDADVLPDAEATVLEHQTIAEATPAPTSVKENEPLQDAELLPEAIILDGQPDKKNQSADVSMENNETEVKEPGKNASDVHMKEAAGVGQLGTDIPQSQPIPVTNTAQPEAADISMGENGDGEAEHPEWEVDSSPIDSSSDDSSDDSSSSDSEDGDNAYKLLSPEEQARILMADGGSDDEGTSKGKGGNGGQLRTKNEVPEVVIPKPDVQITPEMTIVNLGVVETIVENIALIKARTSGEYRVLESGSVLCLEDRSVFGVVAEPLGRVQQPLYSVLFTNPGELKAAGLSIGTNVFYTEKFATCVFTQALKAYKGSDASNIHDEEVGDEEMEFSDDEAEMEHKRKVKQAKRGARGRDGGYGRGGHPLQQQHDATSTINYDEAEDGPYRPLARPAGLINSLGHVEAPQEGADFGARQVREQSRGGGRGDRGRGRGDRGRGDRGRGDRGRGGRGNFQNRGGPSNSNGYSQPPQNRPTSSHQQSPPSSFSQGAQNPQPNGFAAPPVPNFYNMPQQQFSPNQTQFPAWPQFPPPQQQAQPFQQPGFHQAFQTIQQMQQQMQNAWPNMPMPPVPQMPGGAFFNPAFFNNQQAGNNGQWNQQNQQNQQGGESRGGYGGAKKEEGQD